MGLVSYLSKWPLNLKLISSIEATEINLKPVIPPEDVPKDHIYTAVTWISDDKLSVIWTNRVQNESRYRTVGKLGQKWYHFYSPQKSAMVSMDYVQLKSIN